MTARWDDKCAAIPMNRRRDLPIAVNVDARTGFMLYAPLHMGGHAAYIGTAGRLRTFALFGCHTSSPGGRMHRFLTALQRGFHEWIGWKRLGIAASLFIIVIAISTLVRTLK